MVTTILSHEVKNLSEWKKGFDAGEPLRQRAGIKVNGVYSSVDNSNHITIIVESHSEEAVHGFLTNPKLKAAMQAAGVISEPETKILRKV